jgi:hypothetical protein
LPIGDCRLPIGILRNNFVKSLVARLASRHRWSQDPHRAIAGRKPRIAPGRKPRIAPSLVARLASRLVARLASRQSAIGICQLAIN